MRDVLVVCAAPVSGEEPFYTELLRTHAFVVGVDGGAELALRLGKTPDLAIGDFDSATPGTADLLERQCVPVLRFPPDKDASDLDLALAELRRRGARGVTCTAAFSGRFDHTLAAVGSLAHYADLHIDVRDPAFAAYVLSAEDRPELVLHERPGQTLSVFGLTERCVITLEGTRYPLAEADIGLLGSVGLSNVAERGSQRVTLASGRAIVIICALPSSSAPSR